MHVIRVSFISIKLYYLIINMRRFLIHLDITHSTAWVHQCLFPHFSNESLLTVTKPNSSLPFYDCLPLFQRRLGSFVIRKSWDRNVCRQFKINHHSRSIKLIAQIQLIWYTKQWSTLIMNDQYLPMWLVMLTISTIVLHEIYDLTYRCNSDTRYSVRIMSAESFRNISPNNQYCLLWNVQHNWLCV